MASIEPPAAPPEPTAALPFGETSRRALSDLKAAGEPYLWMLGGALALGIVMIVGFLVLIVWNGMLTFYPRPIAVIRLLRGGVVAGEAVRSEAYRPSAAQLAAVTPAERARIVSNGGLATRTLYRTGNFDLYNHQFRWVSRFAVKEVKYPRAMVWVERQEWGPFVGVVRSLQIDGRIVPVHDANDPALIKARRVARARWRRIRRIERRQIGAVNHELESGRLRLRRVALDYGTADSRYRDAKAAFDRLSKRLRVRYDRLSAEVHRLKDRDRRDRIALADVNGTQRDMKLSDVVRMYAANNLSLPAKVGIYLSRWWEFLSADPREANTEGGIWPAIFGTCAMTLLMVVLVTPFGVLAALYLHEYARQGRLVSIVRISVNNLAGVPSIVYGVFGLGFFAYIVGGGIDRWLYPERLPNPTFGTGGLLWASLTLALLTVPVVVVATEEALSAVPRSMREGSLACGASKWQTIRRIVLPRAMPGIITGIILAMARGAGEVAPLMLVGVVKLAPEMPIDGYWPYLHLSRSFMHLGFQIYDVGFQSPNAEAGKPMVYMTTLVLITLVVVMNAIAIAARNRLQRRFSGGQF